LINSQNAPANVTISNNLPGCNSEQEIIDDCGDGCSGTIFINSQVELNELMPCDTIFVEVLFLCLLMKDLLISLG